MIDALKQADSWFLVLAVMVLSGFCLWAIKNWTEGLTKAIQELRDTIRELFEDRNSHAQEIAAIKARCEARHSGGMNRRESDQ